MPLTEMGRLIEDWRTDYNLHRPHTSLGGLAPAAYARRQRQTETRSAEGNMNRLY